MNQETPYKTGYLFDERFLAHDTGETQISLPDGTVLDPVPHPSSAAITRRTHTLITRSGLSDALVPLPARSATRDDVALYHTPAYIERIRALCAAGGGEAKLPERAGDSMPVVPASYDVALLAAGSAMAAVDAVLAGQVVNAFALVRPPGHHAMAGEAMGYCLFNNVVIAARHAQRTHGLRRVMILDWDVHHGNGTQDAFYADPDVLFVSLHQDNWYPRGWGAVDQTGSGAGAGRTVNIPLPPGTGNRGYLEAVERIVVPVARQFRPDLILISAGQDANMMDPLARMMVTMDGFRALAARMQALADELCGGRLAAVQEGGYSASYAPFCTLAVLQGLCRGHSSVPDPYAGTSELLRSTETYSPEQSAAVDAAIAAHRQFWTL